MCVCFMIIAGSGDRVQYELTRYRDLLADTKRDVESMLIILLLIIYNL